MKVGDLVQVLPARLGYYVVVGKTRMTEDYVGRAVYWDLHPLDGTGFDFGGPMDQKFIVVVSPAS